MSNEIKINSVKQDKEYRDELGRDIERFDIEAKVFGRELLLECYTDADGSIEYDIYEADKVNDRGMVTKVELDDFLNSFQNDAADEFEYEDLQCEREAWADQLFMEVVDAVSKKEEPTKAKMPPRPTIEGRSPDQPRKHDRGMSR